MKIDVIYNDNCYKKIKEIPNDSIDCVYIDIPYLYTTGGTSDSPLGQRFFKRELELKQFDKQLISNSNKYLHNKIRIDKYNALKRLDQVDLDCGIDYCIFDDLCRIMKKINIFIWCSRLQLLDIMKYFIEEKKCMFDVLVWAKTNAIPTNRSFLTDLEYCLYFREKSVRVNPNYEYRSKWFCSSSNKKDKFKFGHPTVKPLDLVERHLKYATNEGEIVLDCFLGSGTTAVACKNLSKHYIGIEINKDYYKIALDRLNNVDCNGQFSFLTF